MVRVEKGEVSFEIKNRISDFLRNFIDSPLVGTAQKAVLVRG